MKIIDNLIKYLLIILFFSLPLINSHIFDLLGFEKGFYVEGNYEFTKVIFFNIFSGFISILLILKLLFFRKSKQIFPGILYFIFFITFISTLFSNYFYTSLLGNSYKSHSLLMLVNLILIFIYFINAEKKLLKKLLNISIFSGFFVTIIGIKEYFLPTFDYGDLQNRALSTFGHPNYLALFIIILIPFLIGDFKFIKNNKLNFFVKYFFSVSFIFCLILTKSIWGIFIFLIYLIYKILKRKKEKLNINTTTITFISIFSLIIIFFYKFPLISKLHSFLSRFFIWETSTNIIFSNFKNFFIGSGFGSLFYVFDNFKSPYLYIFENIGFTADRTHNIFIEFFYNFGIFGLIIIIFLIYKLIQIFKKKKEKNLFYFDAIFLFLLFNIFNFASISHYLLIILFSAYIYKKFKNENKTSSKNKVTLFFLFIFSIFGFYFSLIYYSEEYKLKNDKYYSSNNYLYNKIKKENYEKNLFGDNFTNIENMCKNLLSKTKSAENYFYCGNIFWNINKNLSINYYNKGLNKLPDLWNDNSKYLNNFFIKNFVDKKRFFSTKYSNLEEILERVGKKIGY